MLLRARAMATSAALAAAAAAVVARQAAQTRAEAEARRLHGIETELAGVQSAIRAAQTDAASHIQAPVAPAPAGGGCGFQQAADAGAKSESRKSESATECPFGPQMAKYWARRYEFFSHFDNGVQIDKEGLYSVAPELHALALGFQLPSDCHCVLDAFCGVGGNAIGFARAGKRVIAVDTCADRLAMAQNNARVYGVEDRITFVHADVADVLSQADDSSDGYNFDCVHFDPPWGGPGYSRDTAFTWEHFLVSGKTLIEAARSKGCRRIIFRVPRTFDLNQVVALDAPYDVTLQRMFDARTRESYWVLHLTLAPPSLAQVHFGARQM